MKEEKKNFKEIDARLRFDDENSVYRIEYIKRKNGTDVEKLDFLTFSQLSDLFDLYNKQYEIIITSFLYAYNPTLSDILKKSI